MPKRWRKKVWEYGTEGFEHVVKCLSHNFRVGNNYEFGLNFRLYKSVEPSVLDISVNYLEFVLNFGFTEDKLNFLGLFTDFGIKEILECELFFSEVKVRVLFEYLADLLPMILWEFIVEALEQGDVCEIFLDFLFEELQNLIVRFIVNRLNLFDNTSFLGYKIFGCF